MSATPDVMVTEVTMKGPLTAARTYRGLGDPIPIIDANDALAVLAHDSPVGAYVGARDFNLSRTACRLLAEAYGYSLSFASSSDDDDDDDDEDSGKRVNLGDLAWARTRAACGDIPDALNHLRRAFGAFSDAIEVCDAIARKLP